MAAPGCLVMTTLSKSDDACCDRVRGNAMRKTTIQTHDNFELFTALQRRYGRRYGRRRRTRLPRALEQCLDGGHCAPFRTGQDWHAPNNERNDSMTPRMSPPEKGSPVTGPSLLDGVSLPAAAILDSALTNNIAWMQR